MAKVIDAILRLQDELSKPLDKATKNMVETSRQAQRMGKEIQRAGKTIQSVGSGLTKSVTLPIVGLGIGAVKTAADFESAMSQVQATMGEVDKTSESMQKLTGIAKEMGAATKFSATESAEALNYLALAGYDADKQVAALPQVLDLAAAGNMDLAYTTDLVTDSMSALELETDYLKTYIDQMAKTSQKSNTNIAQLGEAVVTVGGSAKDLKNGTIELNTALGVLADVGIKGSEGGTKLRNVINSLTAPTDKAKNAIKDLHLEVFDAEGEMRGLDEVLGDMSKAMEGMTTQQKKEWLNTVFKQADLAAVSGLLASVTGNVGDIAMLLEEGFSISLDAADIERYGQMLQDTAGEAEAMQEIMSRFGLSSEDAKQALSAIGSYAGAAGSRFEELSALIADSEDAAGDMAAIQLDNLQGQITILKSALEGLAISFGDLMLPKIKQFTQGIQNAVDWLNNLDDSQRETIIRFAGIAAAIGPALLVIGKLTSGVGGMITAYGKLGGAIKKAGGVMQLLLSPAGKVILIIAAIAAVALLVIKNWDKIKATFQAAGDYIKTAMDKSGVSLEAFRESFQSVKNSIGSIVGNIISFVKWLWVEIEPTVIKIKELIALVMPIIVGYVAIYLKSIGDLLAGLFKILDGVISFIVGVFTGDWEKAWEGVKKIFSGIFESLAAILKTPMNAVISIINNVIDRINGIGFSIPSWVPGLGGKDFSVNIKQIPMLYRGTDYWQGGPAMIHDRGAEIVDLPTGTRVYPHDKSLLMAREEGKKSVTNTESTNNTNLSRTSQTIRIEKIADTIVIQNDEDIEEIADKVAKRIAQKLKRIQFNMG